MKLAFLRKNFNPEQLHIIELCNTIIERYSDQGYTLTLRQLYYQCIAGELFPSSWRDPVTKSKNNERSYKKLGGIIADARLAGLIDWAMIEDRGRVTTSVQHWDNPRELLEAAAAAFQRDKWRPQPNYVEVMVEKQALEGVLEPVCRDLGIRFTANKGYSSASALYEAGRRLKREFMDRAIRSGLLDKTDAKERFPVRDLLESKQFLGVVELDTAADGRPLLSFNSRADDYYPRIAVIYFGDHDPSGIDMTRDVRERLSMFADMIPLEVHRVALNMDQIEELQPPENPAKETDSRAAGYIAKFGESSWELDAVEPASLASMVREKILEFRDEKIWKKHLAQETKDRNRAIKTIRLLK